VQLEFTLFFFIYLKSSLPSIALLTMQFHAGSLVREKLEKAMHACLFFFTKEPQTLSLYKLQDNAFITAILK